MASNKIIRTAHIIDLCNVVATRAASNDKASAHTAMRTLLATVESAPARVQRATADAVFEAHRIANWVGEYARGVAVADLGSV